MTRLAHISDAGLLDTFQGINKPIWDEIFTKKLLDGDTEKKLIDAITKFKSALTAKQAKSDDRQPKCITKPPTKSRRYFFSPGVARR